MSYLFAILVFSFLVFVHELGHFVAAKLFGVQVNEFSMFMGPALFKKQIGETLYSIRCIPLGGYCAMEGEDEDTDNPRSFQKAAWWKRLIILVAGAGMNFISGVLLFAVLFMPAEIQSVPVISEFTDCCIFNGENGLQIGDEFLEIDGEKIYVVADVGMLIDFNDSGVHDIVIRRGEEILRFDDFPMSHTHTDENGEPYTHYGFAYGSVVESSFAQNARFVWNFTIDNIRNVRLSFQMLLSGRASFADLMGPVGIVQTMSEVTESADTFRMAMENLIYFGGFLSINLAVMNLLPIPALDGGRIVGLLLTTVVEAVTKRKIDPKYEGYLHGVGLILLLILMVIIMLKDFFVIFRG